MVRTTQTRKRSRPSAWGRPMKRRRFIRRRRVRKTRAMVGDQKPSYGLDWKTRRISRHAYKRLLWRQTITATKYHSTYSSNFDIATPAATDTFTTSTVKALHASNDYEPFYTTAGGLLALSGSIPSVVEPTETAATFNSDIIIRGGVVRFEMFNNTETADVANDIIRAHIALIRIAQDYDASALTAAFSPVKPIRYCIPDFNRKGGKVLLEKFFHIKDGESATVEYRLPCQKIDIGGYSQLSRGVYYWVFSVGNGWVAAAQTATCRKSYDLSFCGDAAT